MSKIEKLTPEQEAKIPEYVAKGIEIGCSTKPIDKEKAKKYAVKLYSFLEKENKNPEIIFTKGPFDAWKKLEKLQNTKIEFVWPYLDGQFWSSYVTWINFYKDVVGIKITNKGFSTIIEELVNFGNIYPLDDYCIFAEKMSICHRNEFGLHKEGSPAVEYADGTKLWSLNGVAVPQWLAETQHGKLDPKEFAKIENAEVRREFVRKVGIERICSTLGTKVIDKKDDYELHEIDLGGETGKWPYLKMLNPSIGVWHMECVDKSCKSVQDAIRWRNQSELDPEVLT